MDTNIDQNRQKNSFIFFIKSDVDIFVDLSRCSYTRIYESIMELSETYFRKFQEKSIGGVKLSNNKTRGYFLKIFGQGNLSEFQRKIIESIEEEPILMEQKKGSI